MNFILLLCQYDRDITIFGPCLNTVFLFTCCLPFWQFHFQIAINLAVIVKNSRSGTTAPTILKMQWFATATSVTKRWLTVLQILPVHGAKRAITNGYPATHFDAGFIGNYL